ncbi:hypothetical protein CkaCkLH20_05362 [Colletotrichum karsti]|uniref:Capsule synthesis protein CapA domain-containing protein n=1 Tax=Colletotrichum karsti TaxID=1095194 RepID=A0A9P6LLD0_9PEZI|nr:uncharacterized protein CkaCkLH20_05362 [Colletotrichum karsti]KAF9877096.1 hypothetical protein CkaCkLH20_05362 [Colletotrichum karsti]
MYKPSIFCQRRSSHKSKSPIRCGLRQPILSLWMLFLLAQAVSSIAAASVVATNTGKTWTLAASGDGLGDALDSTDATVQAVWNLTRSATFSFFNMEGAADSDIPLSLAATTPASYILNVSRSAIDIGADVVLVHGPHTLRGVKTYRGRPVFYGLESLTYSLGLDFRGYKLPIEWDDGLIARVAFEDGRLSAVSLHPVIHNQLTNDTTLPERTLPKAPPLGVAQRVLMHLQKVSAAFGTSVRIEGGVGYVDLTT